MSSKIVKVTLSVSNGEVPSATILGCNSSKIADLVQKCKSSIEGGNALLGNDSLNHSHELYTIADGTIHPINADLRISDYHFFDNKYDINLIISNNMVVQFRHLNESGKTYHTQRYVCSGLITFADIMAAYIKTFVKQHGWVAPFKYYDEMDWEEVPERDYGKPIEALGLLHTSTIVVVLDGTVDLTVSHGDDDDDDDDKTLDLPPMYDGVVSQHV